VEFGRRGHGRTLKKVAQHVIHSREGGLLLRGTPTLGLFLCDVFIAAGGHQKT